jgi:hypothetical protein
LLLFSRGTKALLALINNAGGVFLTVPGINLPPHLSAIAHVMALLKSTREE